jgi:hypothetical protein
MCFWVFSRRGALLPRKMRGPPLLKRTLGFQCSCGVILRKCLGHKFYQLENENVDSGLHKVCALVSYTMKLMNCNEHFRKKGRKGGKIGRYQIISHILSFHEICCVCVCVYVHTHVMSLCMRTSVWSVSLLGLHNQSEWYLKASGFSLTYFSWEVIYLSFILAQYKCTLEISTCWNIKAYFSPFSTRRLSYKTPAQFPRFKAEKPLLPGW